MRLIDADAIKLPKGFFEKVNNVPKFYEWLDELPTVELKQKKGRWILPNNKVSTSLDEWICSSCNFMILHKHDFCPNCGADMRGGEDD